MGNVSDGDKQIVGYTNMETIKKVDSVSAVVFLLVICFGMGSWIAVNGMWAELPILVNESPEGWNLPSYMSIVIQVANIGPLLYTLLNRIAPKKVNEKTVVVSIVTVGVIALILLVFLWNKTSFIGGTEHSTALLVLLLFLSIVDCTSTVVFLPFMSTFKPRYITALYLGESLSGMVPSFVALGQGVGKTQCVNSTVVDHDTNTTDYKVVSKFIPPKFPVEDFFIFLACMMAICGVSFMLLCKLRICKNEQVHEPDLPRTETISTPLVETSNRDSDKQELTNGQTVKHEHEDSQLQQAETRGTSRVQFVCLLLVVGWINAIGNGVLPQIQSYACLPYGNEPYHLAVNLSNIASPLACLLTFWLTVLSPTVITCVTGLGTGIAGYVLLLAVQSPSPVLVNTTVGNVLVIASVVIIPFLMTFAKVNAASVFRLSGKKALLWCGIVTQVGSALGTVMMFVTINVFKVFHEKYPCT